MPESFNLVTGKLALTVSSMEHSRSTRFEQMPYVSQVAFGGIHTFLAGEQTLLGEGTGGDGLMNGFLCDPEMEEESSPGLYPVLGVGIVHLGSGEAYSIRKNYPCDYAELSLLSRDAGSVRYLLRQKETDGIGYEIEREIGAAGSVLTETTTMVNTGRRRLSAKQYCHNFLCFDGMPIGPSYRVVTGPWKDLSLVRGSILVSRDGYHPVGFASEQGTIALSYRRENEEGEKIRVENEESRTFVEISNAFPVRERYHWISLSSLCPETFANVDLAPGDSLSFSRTWTFGSF